MVAKDNGTFDDISQFAEVSWPGIAAQGFHRRRRKVADGFAGVGSYKIEVEQREPFDIG